MTAENSHSYRRRSTWCWAFSTATHSLLVSGALALMAEMTLPPPPETFKWDVAMVHTPAPPEEPVATPPPPVQPPPPEPVRTPPPKKTQPIKSEPVVQTPQPVVEQQPVETVQPVQDTIPLQTAEPIQQVETVTRPVQDAVQPAPEVAQAVTSTTTPVETPDTVEHQSVTEQPIVTAALAPTVSSVTERTVVTESQSPMEATPQIEQAVQTRVAPEIQQRAAVQHLAVRSRPTTRPDYGWLSQALWSTVEQRKRYPQEARRNHWEGKVILKLTIEQRGAAIHLLDVTLEESSGHTVLDHHTLDIVRKAFPLDVKHVLAQHKIQLHLPFSYRME